MDRWKAAYAQETTARTLADVIEGADVFVGLSAGGVLKPEHVKRMARDPLIMALANPTPEIMPELAHEARPDAMICTGRSRLSQPGQQRPVLSLHLSRRARRRRERHQRGDEARGGRGDRRAGARDAFGGGGARLQRRSRAVRPRLADPQSVRSAPDAAHRPGGGARGDGERRRAPADRRFRRLRRPAVALRLPLRLHDEAAVRRGARRPKSA